MKKSVRWLLAGAVCTALAPFVSADTVHWCGLDNTYTWSTDLAWSSVLAPAGDEDLVTFQSGDNAVIGSIDGVTDTVPVNDPVSVGNIDFRATATVSGTGAITFADGGGTISVAEGVTATVSAPLAGTVPYVKTGKGALVLSGDNRNLKPTSPLVVREGLLKLTKQQPYSIGCYGTASAPLAVTVENGATLDLFGAYWDVSPYYVNATISGEGHDGRGALIDTGMVGQYNKYLHQISLADDALVRADGQFYCSRVMSNGHTLTKIGNTQFCLSSFEGSGDLRVKQGDFTAFGAASLPGSGKTYLSGGRLTFWQGTGNWNRSVVVESSGALFISGDGKGSLEMVWKGRTEVPAGTWLYLGGQANAYGWNLQTDPVGTGTVCFQSLSNRVTATTLAFPGTLQVDAGKFLWVGTRGSATGGTLGSAGWLRNEGTFSPLGDDMKFSRSVCGDGTTYVIASNKVTLADCVFTNGLSVHCGELTFDGVKGLVKGSIYVGQANTGPFHSLTNVTAVMTFKGNTELDMGSMQAGNGDLGKYGNAWPITGIVNQVSGRIRALGAAGDNDALHLGHWPMGRTTYNMMGGSLEVTDWRYKIAVAVDGRGIFNLSGGDVYTAEFCLNGRDNNEGHGTLNMTGGTLHLGDRGLTVGKTCTTYLANLGGGTVRGWGTNTLIAVKASLTGTGDTAVTFDTADGDIAVRSPLEGTGDFNKTGAGELLVDAACTYTGVGRVKGGVARLGANGSVAGTLAAVGDGLVDLGGLAVTKGRFAGTGVVANGTVGAGATLEGGLAGSGTNTVRNVSVATGAALGVTVTAEGGCGVVDFESAEAVALDRVKVTVSNPEVLDPKKKYVFAHCAAGLTAALDQSTLPDGWHVAQRGRTLVLCGNNGTMVVFR